MSPNVPIYYKWGIIKSINTDNRTVSIASLGEQLIAAMPASSNMFVMPAIGDIWKFHYCGNTYELDCKMDEQFTDIKSMMLPGDMELSAPGVMYIRAARLDMEDDFGPLFDATTGKLNPERLP